MRCRSRDYLLPGLTVSAPVLHRWPAPEARRLGVRFRLCGHTIEPSTNSIAVFMPSNPSEETNCTIINQQHYCQTATKSPLPTASEAKLELYVSSYSPNSILTRAVVATAGQLGLGSGYGFRHSGNCILESCGIFVIQVWNWRNKLSALFSYIFHGYEFLHTTSNTKQ